MFTDRLIEAARYAGVGESQAEIARSLGVSRQRVSMWFLRGSLPAADDAVKMASALGVRPEWLLNGEGQMLPDPSSDGLSSEERDLVKNYRTAAPKVREVIRSMVRAAKKVAVALVVSIPSFQPHPAEAAAPAMLHKQSFVRVVAEYTLRAFRRLSRLLDRITISAIAA